jgi:hypothetical protein
MGFEVEPDRMQLKNLPIIATFFPPAGVEIPDA